LKILLIFFEFILFKITRDKFHNKNEIKSHEYFSKGFWIILSLSESIVMNKYFEIVIFFTSAIIVWSELVSKYLNSHWPTYPAIFIPIFLTSNFFADMINNNDPVYLKRLRILFPLLTYSGLVISLMYYINLSFYYMMYILWGSIFLFGLFFYKKNRQR